MWWASLLYGGQRNVHYKEWSRRPEPARLAGQASGYFSPFRFA
jgi:hypothetical protein